MSGKHPAGSRVWGWGWGSRSVAVAVLLLASFALQATVTETWNTNGTSSANTSPVGVTITQTGPVQSNYVNATLNTTNYWSDPYGGTIAGGPALSIDVAASFTPATFSVTFNEPVDNPVLHIDRLGGFSGNLTNSSRWTLTGFTAQTGGVTMTRLSGNPQFEVTTTTFQRSVGLTQIGGSAECTATPTTGTGCGSIQFNGTGITSLTFSVVMLGATGLGDTIEARWSFQGSSVVVRKQSSNGTGTFDFTRGGALGGGAFSLNTATANPAVSATFPVSNHAQQITLGEAQVPASFTLTGVTCVDQRSQAVNVTLFGGALVIQAGNYGANQLITCTFNNTFNADLSITKTNTPAQGPVDQSGDTVVSASPTTYTVVVRNDGPGAAGGAVLRDPVPTGVSCSTVTCGSATGGAACPPPASVTIAALQSAAGLPLPTLPATGSLTFTLQCSVP